jgi:hypothetical protein
MTGSGREASQPELSPDHAPQAEDVRQVLDRLRSRIEDVAAWAEHASQPGAKDGGATPVRAGADEEAAEPGSVVEPAAAASDHSLQSEQQAGEAAPLDFLRGLARSGAVAGGVFTNGSGIIDLTEVSDAAQVPESGLVALLGLVPSDTVLEVRTATTELRAARLGDEAFAVELTRGNEREVDDWLASLLPERKG